MSGRIIAGVIVLVALVAGALVFVIVANGARRILALSK